MIQHTQRFFGAQQHRWVEDFIFSITRNYNPISTFLYLISTCLHLIIAAKSDFHIILRNP